MQLLVFSIKKIKKILYKKKLFLFYKKELFKQKLDTIKIYAN